MLDLINTEIEVVKVETTETDPLANATMESVVTHLLMLSLLSKESTPKEDKQLLKTIVRLLLPLTVLVLSVQKISVFIKSKTLLVKLESKDVDTYLRRKSLTPLLMKKTI